MLASPSRLSADQLEIECDGDAGRDLILQREQVGGIALEPLRPQMRIGLGVDQLRVDADLVARAAHAPFEHIADRKLAADLFGVDRFVSVGESSVARDHDHVGEPRQVGRDVVGNGIAEILLVGVGAEVDKGQHDDG